MQKMANHGYRIIRQAQTRHDQQRAYNEFMQEQGDAQRAAKW
jgi:hypothetical protein